MWSNIFGRRRRSIKPRSVARNAPARPFGGLQPRPVSSGQQFASRAEVFGVIETALRAHFARQIEALCYRTSKYRRGRSLLALCIALNTKRSTRHITSIATSDILVVVIVVTGLNRVPDKDWSFRISRRHRQFLARASRSCAAGRHYQFA